MNDYANRNKPVLADAPRGKDRSQRKHREDGKTLTGTEQAIKNRLMRQFMRTGEGPGGNTNAYRESSVWCECGRSLRDACRVCNAHVSGLQ